ncbi:MAG: anhydro-N-acetylmuramic acid kinase [Legionellaceae bacterium]|nr:anhydro-N-acetylmuramic acid kinase [Legionellaceae bacterium]HAF87057.1 anhydro-N-acetylmuramic acid kinase [Legionellales bacterium]HCA90176.1 anhydro-N-acetylmuramic acid kinase [Legionellales bacterium]|tara:strand:- start:1646 stop:2749 length:1104 start_codon:yes stop_codon:yes gene_type:complete
MKKIYIGLMSGTSMDGVDAVLCDVETHELIEGLTYPYPLTLKKELEYIVTHPVGTLHYFSQLNTRIGQIFAKAALCLLEKQKLPREQIQAIGSHGQTLCHDANQSIPYTVQLGCAHTIAHLTGFDVVADFRTRDLINHGQGAPLAPLYHRWLFQGIYPLMLINIGGIANVTYLVNGHKSMGYDIGPGNCLMDCWIEYCLHKPYDHNGDWAQSGQVIAPLLASLLKDVFFNLEAPKSIGREYFSLAWLQSYLKASYQPQDVQATLLHLTVCLIVQSIEANAIKPKEILLCGGGAHNTCLLNTLKKALPDIKIATTKARNIDPNFIEGMMCAWLADKCLKRIPLDLSTITGAKHQAILGVIYPGLSNKN